MSLLKRIAKYTALAVGLAVLVFGVLCFIPAPRGDGSHPATYEFAHLFPNGQYRFIEGAGHEIWWDKPEVFVEVIGRFLESDRPPG